MQVIGIDERPIEVENDRVQCHAWMVRGCTPIRPPLKSLLPRVDMIRPALRQLRSELDSINLCQDRYACCVDPWAWDCSWQWLYALASAQLPPGAVPVPGAKPVPNDSAPAPTPSQPVAPAVSKTLAPELVGVWEQQTKSSPVDLVISEDIAPSGHFTVSVILPGQPPQPAAESGTLEVRDGHYKTTGDYTRIVQTGDYTLDAKAQTLVVGVGPAAATWKHVSRKSKQAAPAEGVTPVNVTLQPPADGSVLGWIAAAMPIAKAWHHDAELVAVSTSPVVDSGKPMIAGVGKEGKLDIQFLSPSTRTVMTLLPQDGLPTSILCRDVVDNEAYTFGIPAKIADLSTAIEAARKDGYTPAIREAELSVWTDKDHRPTRCAWVLYNSGGDIKSYCFDAVRNVRIPYDELFGETEKYLAWENKQIAEMAERMRHGANDGAMSRWQRHGDLVNIPCGSEKILCVRVAVTVNGTTCNMLMPSKPLTAEQLRASAALQQIQITPTPGVAFVEAGSWVPDEESVARELARLYDQ